MEETCARASARYCQPCVFAARETEAAIAEKRDSAASSRSCSHCFCRCSNLSFNSLVALFFAITAVTMVANTGKMMPKISNHILSPPFRMILPPGVEADKRGGEDVRINELTPEEHSIVKILRLMSDPDREWTIKIFWVCAGVVVRQWSTPNDKVKNLKEMETELRENIPKLMQEAGICTEKLAQKISADEQRLNDWMNGQSLPTGGQLLALADALGCELDELLRWPYYGTDGEVLWNRRHSKEVRA